MLKDSEPSVVLSAAAVWRKEAVPEESISLELLISPKEKSEDVIPGPDSV